MTVRQVVFGVVKILSPPPHFKMGVCVGYVKILEFKPQPELLSNTSFSGSSLKKINSLSRRLITYKSTQYKTVACQVTLSRVCITLLNFYLDIKNKGLLNKG